MKITEKDQTLRHFTLDVNEAELRYIKACVGVTNVVTDEDYAKNGNFSLVDASPDDLFNAIEGALDQ